MYKYQGNDKIPGMNQSICGTIFTDKPTCLDRDRQASLRQIIIYKICVLYNKYFVL